MAQSSLLRLLRLRQLPGPGRALLPCHCALTTKTFSSLSSAQSAAADTPSSDHPRPTSLSARMSFVFDQIDVIEKERSQKDETLQRIRAWRESKLQPKPDPPDVSPGPESATRTGPAVAASEERVGLLNREVELVHPWPEWIELMERLVQQNYFDHRRKDEEKMVQDLGFQMEEVAEEGVDFTRDWKTVQTACLNFGRDRFDILRSLSRQDIQILVGYGCPSADKKVVFSAKLLRKHTHLDEGDVCSSCSLRNSCEKAYILTNKEDEARTIDVMRILLTYGFDPVNGSVVNESLLKRKSVKTVVRKLLHEIVKLSAVPIDPNLPPPVIKKPPPKVKQTPPPPKKRVGRDDIEMKKGDWLCPKCDFMNFAKNVVCLQCDANRPKRQLLPGEWECPQCNFLNYRRNVVCFHCEHKRPPDEYMENQLQDKQRGPRMSPEKIASRAEVSNAWNFDFDDDESYVADVAAFEYADSHKLDEDFPINGQIQGENFKGSEEDSFMPSRTPRANGNKKPGTGFDDFDDEEDDDDIDSYEVDTQYNKQAHKVSSVDFSEIEGHSESEDAEGFDEDKPAPRRSSSWSHNKHSKMRHKKPALSGSEVDEQDFDSDDELHPVHSKRGSSHLVAAADSRQRTRGRRAMSYGSDEDYGLGGDDFVGSDSGSRRNNGNNRDSRKRRVPESDLFSGLESDEEDQPPARDRWRRGGSNAGPSKRGSSNKFSNHDGFNGSSSRRGRGPERRMNDRDSDSWNSRGGHRGRESRRRGGSEMDRRFDGDDDSFNGSSSRRGRGLERRMNDRDSDSWNSRGGHGGREFRRRGGSEMDRRFDGDDDRYTRPRVNVR